MDAIDHRDGYKFDGKRLRVERTHEHRKSHNRDGDRRFNKGIVNPIRTKYRIKVNDLPEHTSWQVFFYLYNLN